MYLKKTYNINTLHVCDLYYVIQFFSKINE